MLRLYLLDEAVFSALPTQTDLVFSGVHVQWLVLV